MRILPLGALILCLAAAACGGSPAAGAGSRPAPGIGDPSARPAPTDRCSDAGVSPSGDELKAPPVPAVDAHIDGWTMTVRWRFLDMPSECRPVLILITATSVDDLDNITGAGDGGGIPIEGPQGSVSFNAPMLDLPPYQASVSALLRNGLRSPVTTVPVTGAGPACTDSVEACINAARALFQRCVTGQAPRSRCNPKAWRSQPPLAIEPLQGVSPSDLERSFRQVEELMSGGSVSMVDGSLRCNGTVSCRVSWWNPAIPDTRFTVWYRMSAGSQAGTGCWIAARYRVLRQPRDPAAMSAMGGNAFTQPSGCVSWS